MSIQVNNLGDAQIKRVMDRLKKEDNTEAIEYIEALQRVSKMKDYTIKSAIDKIRELSKEVK